MSRIVLNIRDETKVETLLTVMRDLPYVEAQIDVTPKKWCGSLSALDNPIQISGFKKFTREELHER